MGSTPAFAIPPATAFASPRFRCRRRSELAAAQLGRQRTRPLGIELAQLRVAHLEGVCPKLFTEVRIEDSHLIRLAPEGIVGAQHAMGHRRSFWVIHGHNWPRTSDLRLAEAALSPLSYA